MMMVLLLLLYYFGFYPPQPLAWSPVIPQTRVPVLLRPYVVRWTDIDMRTKLASNAALLCISSVFVFPPTSTPMLFIGAGQSDKRVVGTTIHIIGETWQRTTIPSCRCGERGDRRRAVVASSISSSGGTPSPPPSATLPDRPRIYLLLVPLRVCRLAWGGCWLLLSFSD